MPVVGWEGLYEVSDLGDVRSLDRPAKCKDPFGREAKRVLYGRVLKKTKDVSGYYRIDMKYGQRRKNALVHRLIAMAFIENTENKPCINHKDGDKTNNALSNLEWCTHQENMTHAGGLGVMCGRSGPGEKSPAAKITEAQAEDIKRRIASGDRLVDIAQDYPVGKSAVAEIKAGRAWGHVQI